MNKASWSFQFLSKKRNKNKNKNKPNKQTKKLWDWCSDVFGKKKMPKDKDVQVCDWEWYQRY